MAPTSIDEPVGNPVPQGPSSTPSDAGNNENNVINDPQTRNEEKEVSVGEILYGVESFHAIVQPGKCPSAEKTDAIVPETYLLVDVTRLFIQELNLTLLFFFLHSLYHDGISRVGDHLH